MYRGFADQDRWNVMVTDGKITEPLRHIVRHSPDGFSWGFQGSGPAELAHCLLVDHLGHEVEPAVYQAFKVEVIAGLPGDESWEMHSEFVDYWLRSNGFSESGHRSWCPVPVGGRTCRCHQNPSPSRHDLAVHVKAGTLDTTVGDDGHCLVCRSEIEHRTRFVAETEIVDNQVEQLSAMVECEVCGYGPVPAVDMVAERDGWVCWPCSRGEDPR